MVKKAPRKSPLLRQLARRNPDQLWALLVAAGSAPGARHRWATVGHLTYAVLSAGDRGTRPSTVAQLEGLLAACTADDPRLYTLEDFVPSDPRDEVLTRLGDEIVRLFPGSVERPVADVDRALLVADAVDDVLVSLVGFGVRHLLEVALGYADLAIGVLAPHWPTLELPVRGPVMVTDAEYSAAAALVERGTPTDIALSPEGRRALEWMTCNTVDLPYEPGHPQSSFGRFLRVRRGGAEGMERWMPLAFLPEILGYAVTQLAAKATVADGVDRHFTQLVAAQVRRALWNFATNIIGPDDEADGPAVSSQNTVQWVAMLGPGRALLVQVIARVGSAGLSDSDLPAALAVTQAAAADPAAPLSVPMAGKVLTLDPRIEVVPVLVVASAAHLVAPQRNGLLGMSLEDLRWIASSRAAQSDLFLFCREMTRPDRPRPFMWETIDLWEWWRANGKSFFTGGQPPTAVFIEAHGGAAEWERAAERAPLERALATVGLPPLRETDGVDHASSGPPVVYKWQEAPWSAGAERTARQ